MTRIALKGSERVAVPGARVVAPADPDERLEVTLLLRRRAPHELSARVVALASGKSVAPHLSREEFAQRHGAESSDLAAVRAFAASSRLAIVQEHAGRRTVVLSGTVAQFSAAFNVQLQRMQHDGGSYRGRTGSIELPVNLDGIVEAVLGLDNRAQASPHFRVRPAASAGASFTPPQVASLYDFPGGTGAVNPWR